jgi:hypothetical protein
MSEERPPDWGGDLLSEFFKDAQYNERVSALKLPGTYNLLGHIHSLFRKSEEAVEKDNRTALLVPRLLMVRSHSSFLASIRLVTSGQISEAFPVLRYTVEST